MGLEMVWRSFIERYNNGIKWGLVDFHGNDNGEEKYAIGSMYYEQQLKKMEG